jgi:hypothetical protein
MKTRNGPIEKREGDAKSQFRHCEVRWRGRDLRVEFAPGIAIRGAALKGE